MNKNYIITLLLGSTLSVNAQIETDSLQEIIIQSNRLQIPVSEQNRNITVVSKEEIRELPARSINEVLAYVSGVDVRQRGPFGTQTDISLDGGSFEQTIILLNGIKLLDHQTAHNTMNLPIPVEAIERIEILRGPAARIYGINSLTGAINIVTKAPKENTVFAHAFIGSNFKKDEEQGSEYYNGRGVQLGGSYAKNKHGHLFYGSHESGTGYQYNTAYHNNRLFYQGEVKPNEYNKIEAMAGWVRSSFGANGFYAAPGDVESEEIVQTTLLALRSHHQLNDRLALSPQIGYRYNYDDYRYFRHDLSRARSQHYTNSLTGEISGNYRTDIGSIGFGTEARYEQIHSSNIGDHERENYGIFAEFRTKEIPNTDLTVGAYANYNSSYGWQFFPGLDFSYLITDGFKFVFNTGTSQRIPSFTDLYLDQRPGNIGNQNLLDEKGFQIEGGFKYNKEKWETKAVVFHRNIRDFIDWVRESADVPWQANNVGRVKTFGANAGVNYTHQKWKGGLNYTYLNPKLQSMEGVMSKYSIESLRHQIVNTIQYKSNNFTMLLANRYIERISYTDYFLMDFRVSYQHRQLNYYIDLQNILDKTYIEAGAVPMPGRWFTLGVRFNGTL